MLVFYHSTFYVVANDATTMASLSTSNQLISSLTERMLWLAQHLWIGVPIFFVVSGYCIAASVDSLLRKPYSLKQYFQRRLRRIYPPLWIACLCAVTFTFLIAHFTPTLSEQCLPTPPLGKLVALELAGEFFRDGIVALSLQPDRPALFDAQHVDVVL